MPKGLTSRDPVVDPVRAWREGVDAAPTMAERLAEDLAPQLAPGQRELNPREQLAFFGPETPQLSTEAPAELEVGADDPSPVAPGASEVQPDELALLQVPDPDAESVLPLEVFQDVIASHDQEVAAVLRQPGMDLGPLPPGYQQDEQELRQFAQQAGMALATQVCSGGHESPAGAKFCMECGAPFSVQAEREWICSSGHPVDGTAKFCMECGDSRVKAPVVGAGLAAEMAVRPVPDMELTPAGRAERERLHAAALRLGREDPGLVYTQPSGQQPTVLFHVLKSGWTFAGLVWMRGQEIVLEQGTPRWDEAQRFIGWTDAEQYEQYGRLCWRLGPWPGRQSYTQVDPGAYQRLGPLSKNGQEVLGPSEEMLRRADEMEARRGRGVPQPLFARMRP